MGRRGRVCVCVCGKPHKSDRERGRGVEGEAKVAGQSAEAGDPDLRPEDLSEAGPARLRRDGRGAPTQHTIATYSPPSSPDSSPSERDHCDSDHLTVSTCRIHTRISE